jgi:hypothetical protein
MGYVWERARAAYAVGVGHLMCIILGRPGAVAGDYVYVLCRNDISGLELYGNYQRCRR